MNLESEMKRVVKMLDQRMRASVEDPLSPHPYFEGLAISKRIIEIVLHKYNLSKKGNN